MAKKTNPEDWHWADIKAAIEKRHGTLRAFASACGGKGVAANSVRAVKYPDQSGPLAEQRVAEALGKQPHEVWPSRYHADGSRKVRRQLLKKTSRKSASGKSELREVM